MKYNLPKKSTFWAAVILAALGVIIFGLHLYNIDTDYIGKIGFLLVLGAYGVAFLGLTVKGL